MDAEPSRRVALGRDSDFNLQLPTGLDEQTTFILSEPPAEEDSGVGTLPEAGPDATRAVQDWPAGSPAEAAQNFDVNADDEVPTDVEAAGADGDADDAPRGQLSASRRQKQKRGKRVSRHGIDYPPLPPSFVKKVAQRALQSSGLSNRRVSSETLAALTQASDWFFDQLGDDLRAYATHAKRKTIDESDVTTLMRRQVDSWWMRSGPCLGLYLSSTHRKKRAYPRVKKKGKKRKKKKEKEKQLLTVRW